MTFLRTNSIPIKSQTLHPRPMNLTMRTKRLKFKSLSSLIHPQSKMINHHKNRKMITKKLMAPKTEKTRSANHGVPALKTKPKANIT